MMMAYEYSVAIDKITYIAVDDHASKIFDMLFLKYIALSTDRRQQEEGVMVAIRNCQAADDDTKAHVFEFTDTVYPASKHSQLQWVEVKYGIRHYVDILQHNCRTQQHNTQ